MDGIQSLALSTYKNQIFNEPYPNHLYDCLEILVDGNADAQDFESRRPEFDLARWLGSNGAKLDASLKVLCIDREHNVSLGISSACFYDVFSVMRADPAATYLIRQDYDGFHEFHEEKYLLTRFIGTPIYALLWTFDPATHATRAIFIQRRWAPYEEFKSVLVAHRDHIACPWLPGFASCHMLLRWTDRETEKGEHQTIWNIEISTGFGPYVPGNVKWKIKKGELAFDIGTLTDWSQAVNEAAGNLTNKIRHLKISQKVLELIAQEHKTVYSEERERGAFRFEREGHNTVLSKDSQSELQAIAAEHRRVRGSQRALHELGRAVPVLQRQSDTFLEFLAYLHDRSERLSDVVSLSTSFTSLQTTQLIKLSFSLYSHTKMPAPA